MEIAIKIDNIIDTLGSGDQAVKKILEILISLIQDENQKEINKILIDSVNHTKDISQQLNDGLIYCIYTYISDENQLLYLEKYAEFLKFMLDYYLEKWETNAKIEESDIEFFLVSFLVCKKWELLKPNNHEKLLENFLSRTAIGKHLDIAKHIEFLEIENSIDKVRSFINNFISLENDFLNLISISRSAVNYERELLKPPLKNHKDGNYLYVLKRFNSIYPSIHNPPELGGGFFIRWEGKGIVIDPGFDFFLQLQKMGFSIHDVDCILISHAHDDHCRDVSLMMSALFKANKYIDQRKKKTIPVFGTENVYRKYRYIESGFEKTIYSLTRRDGPHQANAILRNMKIPIQIDKLPAKHNEEPFSNIPHGDSMGFSIRLNSDRINRNLIFSGDTMYENSIPQRYYKNQPDIVILNLGKVEEDFNQYYHNHLGIKGCKDLIKELIRSGWEKGLVLISEFGLEMTDYRIKLNRIIKKWVTLDIPNFQDLDINILPTDSGMIVDLNEITIFTTSSEFIRYDNVYPEMTDNYIKYNKII